MSQSALADARRVPCSNCRQLNLRPAGALVMVCDYCRALVSTGDWAPWLPGDRDWASRAVTGEQQARAQQRQLALVRELQRADDPVHRRWLVQENTALQAMTHPQTVLHAYRAVPVERWIEAGVYLFEAQRAAPVLVRWQADMVAATTAMATTQDPIADADALLAAAMRHYDGHYTSPVLALVAHKHPRPDALARSYVRLVVTQYGHVLGKTATERILVEVLGDVVASDHARCPRCDAELSPDELARGRCARCRHRFAVRTAHAWLDEQLAWWPTIAASCHDNPTRLAAALQWILRPHSAARDAPSADDVLMFLSRAVPDVSLQELHDAIALARHWAAAVPALPPILDELTAQVRHAAERLNRH